MATPLRTVCDQIEVSIERLRRVPTPEFTQLLGMYEKYLFRDMNPNGECGPQPTQDECDALVERFIQAESTTFGLWSKSASKR